MPTFNESISHLVLENEIGQSSKSIYLLLDCSNSMGEDGKLDALNSGMDVVASTLKDLQNANPTVKLFIRQIAIGGSAKWMEKSPIPAEQFSPTELTSRGSTPIGKALRLLEEELKSEVGDGKRAPGILLVSDGQPTDDYASALNQLLLVNAADKADRLAIAIGDDADEKMLSAFLSPEIPLLKATEADEIGRYLVLATRILGGQVSRKSLQQPAALGSPLKSNPNDKVKSYSIDPFDINFGPEIDFLNG